MTQVKQDAAPARSTGALEEKAVDFFGMDFAWIVRQDGIPVLSSLSLRRTGLRSGTNARRAAEALIVRAGWITGEVEIEVGTLAAGVVCVDRRPFTVKAKEA